MALKPPLNLWMSSIGFWLGWDEMWGRDHPFLLSHPSLQQILWLESWLSDSATFCFPFSGPSGSSISNRKRRQLGRAELWLLSFLTRLCHWALLWWGQSPSSYGHGVSGLPGDLLPGFQLGSGPGPLLFSAACQDFSPGKEQNTVWLSSFYLYSSSLYLQPTLASIALTYKGWTSLFLLLFYILSFLLLVLWPSHLYTFGKILSWADM